MEVAQGVCGESRTEEEGKEASLGFTHRAGGGCTGVERLAAGHSLEVLQEQPEQRQVELGYFGLLVLKKGSIRCR